MFSNMNALLYSNSVPLAKNSYFYFFYFFCHFFISIVSGFNMSHIGRVHSVFVGRMFLL